MKKILSERNIVIVLFAITFIAFAFATEDGKRLDRLNSSHASPASSPNPLNDTSQHGPAQ